MKKTVLFWCALILPTSAWPSVYWNQSPPSSVISGVPYSMRASNTAYSSTVLVYIYKNGALVSQYGAGGPPYTPITASASYSSTDQGSQTITYRAEGWSVVNGSLVVDSSTGPSSTSIVFPSAQVTSIVPDVGVIRPGQAFRPRVTAVGSHGLFSVHIWFGPPPSNYEDPTNAQCFGGVSGNSVTYDSGNWVIAGAHGATHTFYARAETATNPRFYSSSFGPVTFTVEGINDSAFVSQSVPSAVYVGQSFAVTQSWRNSGSKPWGTNHKLGAQNPQDNGTWGSGRYAATGTVAVGATQSYTFNLTAPATAGTYNFQSRCLQEGVEWFGASSNNAPINVANRPVGSIAPDSSTVYLGQSTTIRATYSTDAARGDPIIETAINIVDGNSGSEWTVQSYQPGNQTWAFTPTNSGVYTFKAYARTALSPAWTVYATSTVTVINRAPVADWSGSPTGTYGAHAYGWTWNRSISLPLGAHINIGFAGRDPDGNLSRVDQRFVYNPDWSYNGNWTVSTSFSARADWYSGAVAHRPNRTGLWSAWSDAWDTVGAFDNSIGDGERLDISVVNTAPVTPTIAISSIDYSARKIFVRVTGTDTDGNLNEAYLSVRTPDSNGNINWNSNRDQNRGLGFDGWNRIWAFDQTFEVPFADGINGTGTYWFRIHSLDWPSWDTARGAGVSYSDLSVTVNRPPTGTFDGISGGASMPNWGYNDSTISFWGTATDPDTGAPVSRVEVYVDGSYKANAALSGSSWTYSWTGTPIGSHSAYVKVYDSLGASWISGSPSFTINNRLPAALVSLSPSSIDYGQSINVTARLTDQDGNLVKHTIWVNQPKADGSAWWNPYTHPMSDNWTGSPVWSDGWSDIVWNDGLATGGTTSTLSSQFRPNRAGQWGIHTNGLDATGAGAADDGHTLWITVSKATPTINGWNDQSRAGTGTFSSAFNVTLTNPHSSAVTAPSGAVTFTVFSASGSGASPTVGATVGASTTFRPGTYVIRASYAGDGNYNSQTWDRTFTVENRAPTVSLTINGVTSAGGVTNSLTVTNGSTLSLSTSASDADDNYQRTRTWVRHTAPAGQPNNLLTNSSFASGTSGFEIYNNTAGSEPATVDYVSGRTGQALRIAWSVNNTSSKGIYFAGTNGGKFQNGRWYIVSVYAKATGTAAGRSLGMHWNRGPTSYTVLSAPALTDTWQRYAWLLRWDNQNVDPNGFISIDYAQACTGTLTVDDVQVAETSSLTPYNNPDWLELRTTTSASDSFGRVLVDVGTYEFHTRSMDVVGAESGTAVVNVASVRIAQSTPVTSSNQVIKLGESFIPTFAGGNGTGNYQYHVSGETNYPGTSDISIGAAGTMLGGSNVVSASWTATVADSYEFVVRRAGDTVYEDSPGRPYTVVVNAVPTSLVTLNTSAITYGQEVEVTARLTDPDGGLVKHSIWVNTPESNSAGLWQPWTHPMNPNWTNSPPWNEGWTDLVWNNGLATHGGTSELSVRFRPNRVGLWILHTNGRDQYEQGSADGGHSAHVSVSKAPLTIKASDVSRPYGTANPALTASYTGLVNGDTSDAIGAVSLSTNAGADSLPGTYPITVSGPSSQNYDISYVPGTLTITKLQQPTPVTSSDRVIALGESFTPTFAGGNGTGNYQFYISGKTNFPGTFGISVGAAGTMMSDTNVVSPSWTATELGEPQLGVRRAGDAIYEDSPVATYTVIVNAVPTSLVVLNTSAIIYGQEVEITAQLTDPDGGLEKHSIWVNTPESNNAGLWQPWTHPMDPNWTNSPPWIHGWTDIIWNNGLAAGASTSLLKTLFRPDRVGIWKLHTNGRDMYNQGAADGGHSAVVSVSKASLTIKANDVSRPYGTANPSLIATYEGLVNGDTAATIGAVSLSTDATTDSLPGTYPIMVSGPSGSNYTISYVPGTLTITKLPQTTPATSSNATIILGQAFTPNYGGGTGSGNYQFYVADVTNFPGTYGISEGAAGTLLGGSNALSVSWTPTAVGTPKFGVRRAGDAIYSDGPVSIYTLTVKAQPVAFVSLSPAAIVYGQVIGVSAQLTDLDGDLVKHSIWVNPPDDGDNPPWHTHPMDPNDWTNSPIWANGWTDLVWHNGLAAAGDTSNLSVEFRPDRAGVWGLHTNGRDASDYGAVSGGHTVWITVGKAPLTIAANSASRPYGQPNPAFTASYSGFVNGDTAATTVSNLSIATSATAESAVGEYAIAASGATASNYNLSYIPGTLTITRAAASVTLSGLSQIYNGQPRSVSATTVPAGLPVVVSYAGSFTAPTDAGSYNVVATVDHPNYEAATTTGTLVVLAATVPTTVGLNAIADPIYNSASQSLAVSASIGGSWTPNAGSVTFALKNAAGVTLASTTVTVTGGVAAGTIAIPAGTPMGAGYHVTAAYGGGSSGNQNWTASTVDGAPFSILPEPVVAAGLRAWYRADFGALTDGFSGVAIWLDASGQGFDLDQTDVARRPMWIDNAINGWPLIDFANGERLMTSPADLHAGGNDLTVIAVFEPKPLQAVLGASVVDYDAQGQQGFAFQQHGALDSDNYMLPWRNQSKTAWQGAGSPLVQFGAEYQIVSFIKGGMIQTGYRDGIVTESATVEAGMHKPFAALAVGGSVSNTNNYFTGRIVEILIYNRALDSAERESVEQELAIRYGGWDTDSDGLPDRWERDNQGDLNQEAGDDFDGDGLTNSQEYLFGTNPKSADSDGDGMTDGEEIASGHNPLLQDGPDLPSGYQLGLRMPAGAPARFYAVKIGTWEIIAVPVPAVNP